MKKYAYFLIAAVILLTAQCKDDNNENEKVIPVTGVSLDKSELRASPGLRKILEAVITPEDATNKAVAWSSSHPALASIDASTGELHALSLTSEVITITVRTVDGGFTDSRTLTVVNVPVTGIKLDEEGELLSVKPEYPLALHATVLSGAAANKNLIWSSSNTSVATVHPSTGVVTGISAGFADIRVETEEGGFAAACRVMVLSPNLLKNGSFEAPDDESAVLQDWVTPVPREWFDEYYADNPPIAGINSANRVRTNDAGFFEGNGAGRFFASIVDGKYCARIMAGNTSGMYQIVQLAPGKKYVVNATVGYRRNDNNASFKLDETLKFLSPDGTEVYHLIPIPVNLNEVYTDETNGARPVLVTKIDEVWENTLGVTEVRVQFDNRNYAAPDAPPLMLVDACEIREMPE